ncbi:MAG: PhzF family phenazine biosynthesis protein, partial [Exiguobacterium sp.]
FASVLTDYPQASIHPICFDTYDAQATLHGCHFSATGSGSIEDPVTGTASGVMGVYYRKFMKPSVSGTMITVEQGHEIGRSGQAVFVGVKKVGEEEADVETLHLGF